MAILATGLAIVDVQKINDVLDLAGYAPLTTAEAQMFHLALPHASVSLPVRSTTPPNHRRSFRTTKARLPTAGILLASVTISCLIAASSGHGLFLIVTGMLYAALYADSLLQESALDTSRADVWPVAAWLSALMLLSSVAALAIDEWLASIGNPAALALSLGITLIAAAVQWVISRTVLSESVVVPLRFQAHTAQAAHLKNTSYFLVIVVLFWVPPFHCVAAMQREIRTGHSLWAKSALAHRVIVGKDFAALNPELLWFAFAGLGLLALAMAVRLLENLSSHPSQNRYTALLYLRAVLYFLLVLICLFWYSSELGSLPLGEVGQP
ncbi:MAG: hypothetical protein HY040_26215 [Planctomycetes bacterium]|nr:hypothetical protein [Planctomycetota bacterium]